MTKFKVFNYLPFQIFKFFKYNYIYMFQLLLIYLQEDTIEQMILQKIIYMKKIIYIEYNLFI